MPVFRVARPCFLSLHLQKAKEKRDLLAAGTRARFEHLERLHQGRVGGDVLHHWHRI